MMKKQAVLLSLLLFVFIAGCETKTTGEVTRVVCDGWPDIGIEVRVMKDGNAFLYLKELKGPLQINIPTGEQVSVEEHPEPAKISLLPKVLVPEKLWWRLWGGFENFVKEKADYWASQARTTKWLLPSTALLTIIILIAFLKRRISKKRGG